MKFILSSIQNLFTRREPTLDEQYLADAVDLVDLELRQRQLDDHRSFNAGWFRLATARR